jgi:hypothetical protein
MVPETRNEMDILNPEPIYVEIGRAGEIKKIQVKELVLRQYTQLFKVFSRILSNVISSGELDFTNMESIGKWTSWLPKIVNYAGDDVNELVRVALEIDEADAGNITGKQLPVVLTKIVEVNGLEQINVGFRRLSAIVIAEIMKQRVKEEKKTS